jgi:integrase
VPPQERAMATIVKTDAGSWKALIRKQGWPTTVKTFRTKRDAEDWSRRTEDEMVRGVYIERSSSERLTLASALDRYLREVTPTKKASTQDGERKKAKVLRDALGAYSLAALTPDVIARFRDARLSDGRRANTVRLELALLGHLFTIAIKEWQLGLAMNPVANIRKPSPAEGRNRRLSSAEEKRLLAACDAYSNPIFGWIVRLGIETAMRKSEITSLRRPQVDLKRRIVRLQDTKNGSARTVPLTKAAAAVLRQALVNPIRPLDSDLIFFGELGRDGTRRPYRFERIWDLTKRKLGMRDLHFHDLRHEATSRFVEDGLSDQEVSAITGHKYMQMLKRYTHLRAEDLVARLDRVQRRPTPAT